MPAEQRAFSIDGFAMQLLLETHLAAVAWDVEGRIDFCNDAFVRLCGYRRDELLGEDWFAIFVPPAEREAARAWFRQQIDGEPIPEDESAIVTRDGEERVIHWNLVPLRDGEGRIERLAALGADVTERLRDEERQRHDSLHDPLTGLAGRALFIDRLSHRFLLEKRRQQTSFSVLCLDVDRFKAINDGVGHVQGDVLLVEVARRLERCLRPGDTLARFGGDEFAVLLEDIPKRTDACAVAERLQQAMRAPFRVAGKEVASGVSIGIAHGHSGYARPEDILRDADLALYQAKATGRGRSVEFDPSMHDQAVALLQLESDLRRALDRRELRLYYQPTVALRHGGIVGAEALLRWVHPQRGVIAAAEFLRIAEETGLIVPIGAWVLREACRQMKEWQDRWRMPKLEIAVNLSSRQFRQPGLVREVADALQQSGLSPRTLRLEVTERVLMEKDPHLVETMTELREMGVHIDLDDFGTGYSSLSYLHQFPLDTLKIDRGFVQRMAVAEDGLEVLNTIFALASSLDMEVVAKGVDSVDQFEMLRKLHCGYAQGFHLSRPLDADDFGQLLGEGRSFRR